MAEGRQREAWNHTAQLLAMIYNVNRDPKSHRALKPGDFHPFAKERHQPKIAGKDLSILRDVFVKEEKKAAKQPRPGN